MAKSRAKTDAGEIPVDLPTMGLWLAHDPAPRLELLCGLLSKAKKSEQAFLAETVRIALKRAWDGDPKTFFKLAGPWLKGDDPLLRRIAAGAVPLSHEEYHEKSVKALKKLVTDDDVEVRRMAVDLLAEEINDHLGEVKRWLKDKDPQVRACVVRHLRNLATDKIRPEISLFEGVIEDPAPEVHWAVASTLQRLYEREQRPVIEMMKFMADSEHEGVRAAAAACFFEHAFADYFDQLLPTMRAWLRTDSPRLRWTLVRSLRFVALTARSMQLIRALYEDPDEDVRRRLVQAMIDLYDPISEARRMLMPLLQRARQDPSKKVRDAVEEGVERLGEEFEADLEPTSIG